MANSKENSLKNIPSVDEVLGRPELQSWKGSRFATEAVREELEKARQNVIHKDSQSPNVKDMAILAACQLEKRFAPGLNRVLNATGIVIHTNLGRCPLSEDAIEAMLNVARGYSSLEMDLDQGRRGSRHNLVRHLLISLTGAEDALVTNNNAAGVLLALTALSRRKEVVVSRGQLVEIGGSFRIPDICRAGGAKLHEVGTTNRTRISDYEEAISARTGILLSVHSSNYRIIGFTEEVELAELVKLGDRYSLPVVNDLGSGALVDPSDLTSLKGEPVVSDVVKTGASVVTFSGDKLLGGPQAGIVVGKAQFIKKMRKHPLMRALRPDKLCFAALDATLRRYLAPARITGEIPVWRMLTATVEELENRARSIVQQVKEATEAAGFEITIEPSDSYTGGGSLPTERLESRAVCFSGSGRNLKSLQRRLRLGSVPLIAYIKSGKMYIDQRTLLLEDEAEIIKLIRHALRRAEEV